MTGTSATALARYTARPRAGAAGTPRSRRPSHARFAVDTMGTP
jgi:hypothetical protein